MCVGFAPTMYSVQVRIVHCYCYFIIRIACRWTRFIFFHSIYFIHSLRNRPQSQVTIVRSRRQNTNHCDNLLLLLFGVGSFFILRFGLFHSFPPSYSLFFCYFRVFIVGERLIQYASENLVTEILIHPQYNTLIQCMRNMLSSFTKHRHIIHSGYTFSGNGSWILQVQNGIHIRTTHYPHHQNFHSFIQFDCIQWIHWFIHHYLYASNRIESSNIQLSNE